MAAKFPFKRSRRTRGQAAIELALVLPFLIYLIFYMLNAYGAMHSAHVGLRYAAMNLYQRVNNRAQFAMDDLAGRIHNRGYMAVQYTEPDGRAPRRKIVVGPIQMQEVAGICREPRCN